MIDEVKIKEKIKEDYINGTPRKQKSIYKGMPVYVDGNRYESMFSAATNAGISHVHFWKRMKILTGAPCIIKKHHVVLETWISKHPEYLENL